MSNSYETELDHVQTHMLGLIVNIMSNYGLTEEHITQQLKHVYDDANQYSAIDSDSNDDLVHSDTILDTVSVNSDTQIPIPIPVTPEAVKTAFAFKINPFLSSWASDDEDDDYEIKPFVPTIKNENKSDNKKMYVAHRRDFRDALSSGTKICANYIDCTDDECVRFHVLPENLCEHAGRNNYCSESNCDKIVIKACRKGKRCNDPSCSFRH